MDQVYIQHRFKIEREGKSYSDALVLPINEYEALSPSEIENLKEERFTNWKEVIENPIPEPTKEELLAAIDKELSELTARRQAIEAEPVKGGTK